MGLDMYVYQIKSDLVEDKGDVDVPVFEIAEETEDPRSVYSELWYWRKFYALHEYMHELYTRKGGTDEMFNCNNVRLDLQDILDLEACKLDRRGTLSEQWHQNEVDRLPDFFAAAKAAIKDGYSIFYSSWW